MDDVFSPIDLTLAEIYAATRLLGGQMVLGVRDPFANPLTDPELLFETGLATLSERGLLAVGTFMDDTGTGEATSGNEEEISLGVDPVLAAMILVLTGPEATFLQSCVNEADGEELDIAFHLVEACGVMLQPFDDDRYRLTPLDGASDIQDLILAIWEFADRDDAFFAGAGDTPPTRVRGHIIALRHLDDDIISRSLAIYRDESGLHATPSAPRQDAASTFEPIDYPDLTDRIDDLVTRTVYPTADLVRSPA